MADTLIPALVGQARGPDDLRVEQDDDADGHVLLTVRGMMISVSLNGFRLARALRDTGFADVDLIKEIVEEAELVDDDDRYGYFLGTGIIDRLRSLAEVSEEPVTETPGLHESEVVTYTRARGPHPRISFACCTCGWQGPERGDTQAADEDLNEHLRSTSPIGFHLDL